MLELKFAIITEQQA